MTTPASWPAFYARLALRAAVRPRLALDLLRLAWSFRARDWWRAPPLPPPPPPRYPRRRLFPPPCDEKPNPPVGDPVKLAPRATREAGTRPRAAKRGGET